MTNYYDLDDFSLIRPTILSNGNWEKAKEYEIFQLDNEFYLKAKIQKGWSSVDKDLIDFFEENEEILYENRKDIIVENAYLAVLELIRIRHEIPNDYDIYSYNSWDVEVKRTLAERYLEFVNKCGLLGLFHHIFYDFISKYATNIEPLKDVKMFNLLYILGKPESKVRAFKPPNKSIISVSDLIKQFFPTKSPSPSIQELRKDLYILWNYYSEPLQYVIIAIDRLYSLILDDEVRKNVSNSDNSINISNVTLDYSFDKELDQYVLKSTFRSLFDYLLYVAALYKISSTKKILICEGCGEPIIKSKRAKYCSKKCGAKMRKRKSRAAKKQQNSKQSS